jgi:hypothetical protein
VSDRLAGLLETQAEHCLPSSPLTHRLLLDAAADLRAGGVVAEVLAGHEDDTAGSAPGLRLAAALHRLALLRLAPRYALLLPTTGGTSRPELLWPAAADALHEHRDTVRAWVSATAVQTNEVGRGGPQWGGLQVAAQRAGLPVRLLEVGASAGLNLRPDRLGLALDDGTVLGDAASPLRLAPGWTGRPPARLDVALRVAARSGCDPDPVDVGTPEGRAHLGSFVWADDLVRWERLRAGFALAASLPVAVQRAPASAFLARELAAPAPGVLTVVWHSVVVQYLAPDELARVRGVLRAAGGRATAAAPLAVLGLEPSPDATRFELSLRTWPGGGAREVLGWGSGHGVPFTWA